MSAKQSLIAPSPPYVGCTVRVYLRTAGRYDSLGSGLLMFGQQTGQTATALFWHPRHFQNFAKNLYFFVKKRTEIPQSPLETQTASTYAPIFCTEDFQTDGYLMAYNMKNATRIVLNLPGELTRQNTFVEPPPPKLPRGLP